MNKLLHGRIFTIALVLLFLTNTPFAHAQTGASLSTDPQSVIIGINQLFSTNIVVDTGENSIGGVGAILLYDPQVLVVDHIETDTTFDDYPLAAFDNDTGRVSLSGVVGSPDALVKGVKNVGKVFWKAVGLGDTTVKFDYTPESTTDSNVAVTTGNGDALSSVSELSVTVVEEPQSGGIVEDTSGGDGGETTVIAESQPEPTQRPFLARVGSFVNRVLGRPEEQPQIDAYAPLTAQAPKTTFTETTSVEQSGTPQDSLAALLPVIGALLLGVVLLVIVVSILKRRKGGGTPPAAHVSNGPDAGVATHIAPVSTPSSMPISEPMQQVPVVPVTPAPQPASTPAAPASTPNNPPTLEKR